MEELAALRTERTHLFVGALLAREETTTAETGHVVLLFGDGERAEAHLVAADDRLLLRVDAHRTAAGTAIPAKTWLLAPGTDGTLRVVRRRAERSGTSAPQDGSEAWLTR